MPEQFDMPELLDLPEEALWEPPIESLRKKNKDNEEDEVSSVDSDFIDTALLPPDDPWYCDPDLQSDECPQPCDPKKYWCDLPCDCPLDSDGDQPKFCDECPRRDSSNDTLPKYLRLCFQIVAMIFEFHVVFLAILPWWGMGIGLILADLIYDWFWYLIFFAWCKPCAWVFIWILNIPMLGLHLPYYYQRLQLELVGFIFDGWMVFVGGDGCFLRWGQDCWFAKRIKDKDNMTWTDLVWLSVRQPAFQSGSIWLDMHTEDAPWWKVLGFPGTQSRFMEDMEGRKR